MEDTVEREPVFAEGRVEEFSCVDHSDIFVEETLGWCASGGFCCPIGGTEQLGEELRHVVD